MSYYCKVCKMVGNFDTSRYKIQYGDKARFAEWSDWLDAGTPLPDSNILSIITEHQMTVDDWNNYANKNFNND